jgi:hypothetical protein
MMLDSGAQVPKNKLSLTGMRGLNASKKSTAGGGNY